MRNDYRGDAARFYDVWANFGDVDFYRSAIPGPDSDVLELGCGTGRVLVALVERCRFIQGVDLSESMLSLCRRKLADRAVPPERALVQRGNICAVDLGRTFNLVTAPFRVMQNLETDAEIDGLCDTIRRHLAPNGTAILNAFRPRGDRDALFEFWSARDGTAYDEKRTPEGLLRMTDDCRRFQADPLIVFPVLKYERVKDGRVIDAAELPISMRVWYPEELLDLIATAGFRVTDRWGGYDGEPWGEGPELVVAFTHA